MCKTRLTPVLGWIHECVCAATRCCERREKIVPRSLSSSSVWTPSAQQDGPHSGAGSSCERDRKREEKVHICEPVNYAHLATGGQELIRAPPPPPRKTGTLRPVYDSLNQSTGVMSASTNLTPFTLWPVKHRNAINKWLQGVLMILVLYFYTTGRHLSVRPGEQHLDAANHANRFLKLWARLTDGWKHSRTVLPNDCTPCSDTDTYGLTGELNNHNNIWQHFYTGSKSQGTRLKNTKKCKNTCMW